MIDRNVYKLKYLRASLHIPDRVFVKRMRHWQFPDETLEVHLNRWRGLWEIWRIPKDGMGRPCHIHETPSLDQRALLSMERRWFTHTSRSPRELCLELDRLDYERKALSDRSWENTKDAIATDQVDGWRDVSKAQVPLKYGVSP